MLLFVLFKLKLKTGSCVVSMAVFFFHSMHKVVVERGRKMVHPRVFFLCSILFLTTIAKGTKKAKVTKVAKVFGFSHPGLINYINLKQCCWVPTMKEKNSATTLKF